MNQSAKKAGRLRSLRALAGLLAAAVTITGCGSAAQAVPSLTIYSSFPLQGAQRTISEGTLKGMRLALAQAHDHAGRFKIVLVSLDDSTAEAGAWDPGQTALNARQAAADRSAVAYIGEYNSGASAVSIPILNEAGVPQVSPGNTAVGLTTSGVGAEPGEPGKYYPTGRRTFLRIIPRNTIQGAAIARLMRDRPCQRIVILNDKELYGRTLAANVVASARALGLRVLLNRGFNTRAPNYHQLVARLAALRADCALFSGTTPNNAVQLFRDLAAGLPHATLFGPNGVAESDFVDPAQGGLPPAAAVRTWITTPTLDEARYPPSAARDFYIPYRRAYGPLPPEPYAIYGYEAMRLVLNAIAQAGPHGYQRAAVLRQLMATHDRHSVLGTYSIDPNGDTTLTDYGAYRIRNGQLTLDHVIHGQ